MASVKPSNAIRELFFDVSVKQNVKLKPNHEHIVYCVSSHPKNIKSDAVIMPDNFELNKKGLFGAYCLVKVESNELPLKIINLSDRDVYLQKNTKMGTLELVEEEAKSHQNDVIRMLEKSDDELMSKDQFNLLVNEISSNPNLTVEEKQMALTTIKNYKDVFSINKMDIGCCKEVKHSILMKDVVPINQPFRRVPLGLETKVDELVEDLVNKNIIRLSESPWNSPLVVIKKKNGDIRLCIDFRLVNSVTQKTSYPIPETQHLLDSLTGSMYFSTLDLSSAYYQVEIEESHKKYTAFATRRGHYEFNRMPFGLHSAPFTFQRMMHLVLRSENWQQCLIYLDDVLIFAETFHEHMKRICNILSRFKESGIKLSPEKCHFFKTELCFLGHVVSRDGIKTDPTKIQVVKDWKKPMRIEDMRRFLGFANYYRKFVISYAKLSAPLENLMKTSCKGNINLEKRTILKWDSHTENCYEKLKTALISAPVLGYPRKNDSFVIDCDASHDCIGAVLSQIQDGNEVVIAYASRKLTNCELNYCVTRKELLAVYYFVTYFKHYLLGRKFTIRTDHKALKWLLAWNKPNTSQYCTWIAELEIFDFDIHHRPGAAHANADFLSRTNPCQQCDLTHENPMKKRNVKLLQPAADENIRTVQSVYPARSVMKQTVKDKIISQFHNALGHIGVEKTLDLLRECHTWPNMEHDVKEYIGSCIHCAKRKVNKGEREKTSIPIIAKRPFEKLMIDITGPLPQSSHGHKYILGIIDIFSRYIMLVPLKSTETKIVTDALLQRWISIFGCPNCIISDGGKNLNSKLMSQFCRLFNIDKHTSSPYHPASNGIIERSFRTVKDLIYATSKDMGKDWISVLPHVEIGLRVSKHKTVKFSPFEVIFGRKMRLPQFFSSVDDNYSNSDDYIQDIQECKDKIAKQILDNQMTRRVDIKKPQYKLSQLVMVRKVRNNKAGMLQSRYFGPCIIIEIMNPKTYRLRYKDKIFSRHIDHLKSYSGKPPESQQGTSIISEERIELKNNFVGGETGSCQNHNIREDEYNPNIIEDENNQETLRYPSRERSSVQRYGY